MADVQNIFSALGLTLGLFQLPLQELLSNPERLTAMVLNVKDITANQPQRTSSEYETASSIAESQVKTGSLHMLIGATSAAHFLHYWLHQCGVKLSKQCIFASSAVSISDLLVCFAALE